MVTGARNGFVGGPGKQRGAGIKELSRWAKYPGKASYNLQIFEFLGTLRSCGCQRWWGREK